VDSSVASTKLNLFVPGRTNQTSKKQLEHFFKGETFGPDYHRRDGPAGGATLGPIADEVRNDYPLPGANDANGVYVEDCSGPINLVSILSLFSSFISDRNVNLCRAAMGTLT
jgi:hypothetical protein